MSFYGGRRTAQCSCERGAKRKKYVNIIKYSMAQIGDSVTTESRNLNRHKLLEEIYFFNLPVTNIKVEIYYIAKTIQNLIERFS